MSRYNKSSSTSIPKLVILVNMVMEFSTNNFTKKATDGRTEQTAGRTDGRTDRCKLIKPFFQSEGIIKGMYLNVNGIYFYTLKHMLLMWKVFGYFSFKEKYSFYIVTDIHKRVI